MMLYKLLLFVFHLWLGILLTFIYTGILRFSFQDPIYQKLIRWWHRRILKIFHIQLTIHGEPSLQPMLYVANHISWLDISSVGSVSDIRFLSKQEIKHWPLLGWITEKAGTLFIPRGQKGAAASANQALVASLQAGHNAFIFPEGTTTDGQTVGRFHSRLFASAIEAGVDVQPMVIYYPKRADNSHQRVPFVGEQTFVNHLWGILSCHQIDAEIEFLPKISSKGLSRKELAALCEQAIRAKITQYQ